MSDIQIFEPAMCCSTGLCGPSIDPELLRVSTIFDALQKEGVSIERFNLSGAPEAFVQNAAVTKHLQAHGMESLLFTAAWRICGLQRSCHAVPAGCWV